MVSSKFDISGKLALITGGAGLLGIEHAIALLECGADVVVTDSSKTALDYAKNKLKQMSYKSNIYFLKMDVTSLASIASTKGLLERKGLRVDILINNAAIDPKVNENKVIIETSRFENITLNQWNQQIEVGLTGAFLCSQMFGTAMVEDKKGGVILNIASDLSVFAPDQRLYRVDGLPDNLQPVKPVTYSVIKTALIGLTRYLATYWGGSGVRSNALSPGGVYNNQDKEFVRRLSALIPMGRMANRDEYRSAIQFLCSDASSYLNGQNIIIDGGRSVW